MKKKHATYKSKIQILTKSLNQIVNDFEKQKELVRYQHEAIIKEQRTDIINARENLRVKNRELRNVRALAQVILDQRSEVEQFFLEALEQIKEEIRKKISQEKKLKKSAGQDVQPDEAQKPFGDKVDLNDLEWEDRERVLRLLFSKMNSGVNNSGQMKHKLRQAASRQKKINKLNTQGLKEIQ